MGDRADWADDVSFLPTHEPSAMGTSEKNELINIRRKSFLSHDVRIQFLAFVCGMLVYLEGKILHRLNIHQGELAKDGRDKELRRFSIVGVEQGH